MRPRTAMYILVGALISVALVFIASNLQAGSGSSLAEMMAAQRHTPLLWVVDICTIGFFAGTWWYAKTLDQFQNFVDHQAKQHHEQLDSMIERMSMLEQENDTAIDRTERLEAELVRQSHDLTDQIATLEAASDARRQVFETETRRISEYAYRLALAHLEGHSRQVEAVTSALQYQAAELRGLREELHNLHDGLAPELGLRLSPPDFLGIHGSALTLSVSSMVHEPEREPLYLELDEAQEDFRAARQIDRGLTDILAPSSSCDEEECASDAQNPATIVAVRPQHNGSASDQSPTARATA